MHYIYIVRIDRRIVYLPIEKKNTTQIIIYDVILTK